MGDLTMKMLHGNVSNKYRTLQNDKVRVCFYGRVSTQHEAQMNALLPSHITMVSHKCGCEGRRSERDASPAKLLPTLPTWCWG